MSPTTEDHGADDIDALRAEIDVLERAIAQRDAAIEELAQRLAAPVSPDAPKRRLRERVRELEATLVEARREREAVRASVPTRSSELKTAVAAIVLTLLAVGIVFVGCHR